MESLLNLIKEADTEGQSYETEHKRQSGFASGEFGEDYIRCLRNENSSLRKVLYDVRNQIDEALVKTGIVIPDKHDRRIPNTEGPLVSTSCQSARPSLLDVLKAQQKRLSDELLSLFASDERPNSKKRKLSDDASDKTPEECMQKFINEMRLAENELANGPPLYEDNEHVNFWRQKAERERETAKREIGLEYMPGRAVIICLDTSGSMREGNAWQQAKQFLFDYVNGIQDLWEQGSRYDYIGIVTFGEEVCVKAKPIQELGELKTVIDNLTPGGPTPLFGGLVMARFIACTPVPRVCVNNYPLRAQVILVTDGKPSEIDRTSGSDDSNSENLEMTKTIIIDELKFLQIADFHCVLVGDNADRAFLTNVQQKGRKDNRRLLTYQDGSEMAWFTTNEIAVHGDQKYVNPTGRQSSSSEFKTIRMFGTTVINVYKECCQDRRFDRYTIGTRVRRGDDWSHYNQDGHGVGTIIGHYVEQSYMDLVWVWVEWDNGEQYPYCIKSLSTCNEDRIPPEGETIAVGSFVRPGKDFNISSREGDKTGQTGVVIKFRSDKKASVRWNDVIWGYYYHGKPGTPEEIEPVRVPEPPFDLPDQHLNEKQLNLIAQQIGKNWKELGAQLGLPTVTLEHIEEDRNTAVSRISAMLNKWKTNVGPEATLQRLLRTMRENATCVSINWRDIEKVLFSGKIPQWYKNMFNHDSAK